MRRNKRIISLLTAIILGISLISGSALAAPLENGSSEDPATYPTVFVHGLFGWGSYDSINSILPYWGLVNGSMLNMLNENGYHCYAASVGPYSSAWDRSCELYAQLTGTRTDYGIAHSKEHGHERFGPDFTGKALIPDFTWDKLHKINLVGHSFGGVTIRLFTDLLYDGSYDERAASEAAGEKVSPLFAGGHGRQVYSITTIGSPHNGSTYQRANPEIKATIPKLWMQVFTALDRTATPGVYDPRLEQFGLKRDPNETILQTMQRVASSDFYDHHDNAVDDMSIEKSMARNKEIEVRPDIYYFSWYGDRTITTSELGCNPKPNMQAYLIPFSYMMCKYTGYSSGSWVSGFGDYEETHDVPMITLDEEWQPNDGLVNVVSGKCPFYLNESGNRVYNLHVDYRNGRELKQGAWNIFPAQNLDHIAQVGGLIKENYHDITNFYKKVMTVISETEANKGKQPTDLDCPSERFTDVDKDGWYHMFIDYVLNNQLMTGTDTDRFSPSGTVTRAMAVQTLYAMEDYPWMNEIPFKDVPNYRYYSKAVSWASKNGIVKGYADNTFRPDVPITRQQLVAMFYAYGKYEGLDMRSRSSLEIYADESKVAGYAKIPLQWALAVGLIGGRDYDSRTLLCPQHTTMRSELAVMLMRLNEELLLTD